MDVDQLKEIEERVSDPLYCGSEGAVLMINSLLSHIQSFESQIPRWIPVSERLPEKDGLYLINDPLEYVVESRWFQLNSCNQMDLDTKEAWGNVTHWMPLPPAPEEE